MFRRSLDKVISLFASCSAAESGLCSQRQVSADELLQRVLNNLCRFGWIVMVQVNPYIRVASQISSLLQGNGHRRIREVCNNLPAHLYMRQCELSYPAGFYFSSHRLLATSSDPPSKVDAKYPGAPDGLCPVN
jgi:hypothetical protein